MKSQLVVKNTKSYKIVRELNKRQLRLRHADQLKTDRYQTEERTTVKQIQQWKKEKKRFQRFLSVPDSWEYAQPDCCLHRDIHSIPF